MTTSPAPAPAAPPRSTTLWVGRVLSALPTLMLLGSAAAKLSHAQPIVENFAKFGYPEPTLVPIGVVELLCAVLYAVPRTAVLGAVLVTGYLGGAVATHVRVGEPFFAPFILGVIVWGGLYFRDPRVRALLPLR